MSSGFPGKKYNFIVSECVNGIHGRLTKSYFPAKHKYQKYLFSLAKQIAVQLFSSGRSGLSCNEMNKLSQNLIKKWDALVNGN